MIACTGRCRSFLQLGWYIFCARIRGVKRRRLQPLRPGQAGSPTPRGRCQWPCSEPAASTTSRLHELPQRGADSAQGRSITEDLSRTGLKHRTRLEVLMTRGDVIYYSNVSRKLLVFCKSSPWKTSGSLV